VTADFRLALFLARYHPTDTLDPWERLTTGLPPTLDRNMDRDVEARVATDMGTPEATLARSALHGLIDAVAATSTGGSILIDEAVYPIARWAAATAGRPPITFDHYDTADARRRCRRLPKPVVIIVDGWCPSCGRPAPITSLAELAGRTGGHLVVDDSLAMGVLGRRTAGSGGFGHGGGGSLARSGTNARNVLVVASLAKAFGVPLAVIAGPAGLVRWIRQQGPTSVHASGPTSADRAALRALVRTPAGDLERARRQLEQLTINARARLSRQGLTAIGPPFPLIVCHPPIESTELVEELSRRGVAAFAVHRRCQPGAPSAIGFAIRSDHRRADLEQLELAICETLGRSARGVGRPSVA
jgi:8-amino-7-oxononanoate synthase